MKPIIEVVDLYCGASGATTGIFQSAQKLGLEVRLLGINHWNIAIATSSTNYPGARYICDGIDNVNPRQAVPGGHLDMMWASPECTHHSNARGGKPRSDQSRANAWVIVRWAEALDIDRIIIENVEEFRTWCPLDASGQPIWRLKGKTYLAFLQALRSLGYQVSERVLNCADYGDPTTRERLFILARKGKRPRWPEPTHSRIGGNDMLRQTERWIPAKHILDWSLPAYSIFMSTEEARKYKIHRPLSPNTIRRIEAGLRKFSGLPFVLGQQSGATPRSVEQPVPTVAGVGAISLIQPFLVQLNGTAENQLEATALDVNDPVPTLTGTNHLYLAQPFLFSMEHSQNSNIHSVNKPMPTVTSADAWAMAQPFLVRYHGESYPGGERVRSVDDPIPAVSTIPGLGLAQPFLVKYYGTGDASAIDSPVPTLTTKDRMGLVQPIVSGEDGQFYLLDVLYRMLQPHELAAAMSFPQDYYFAGNREEKVKQVGNAVPCMTATALCEAMLADF